MTKDEILKIKKHIEIHARQERRAIIITELLWKAVDELEHITDIEKENEQLKAQVEKMKNCDNCKNLIECTNRRYEKMTSNKMTMIRFPCCWRLAE